MQRWIRPLLLCTALLAGAFHGVAAAQDTPWTPEEAQLLGRAQNALQNGQPSVALADLVTLLQARPENGSLHRLQGHALVALERDDEARAAFMNALHRGELTVDLLSRVVEIDLRAGRQASMLAATELLVLLEPDRSDWKRLYADLLLSAGELEASQVVYSALRDENYADPKLHERLSRIAQQRGDHESAALDLELAYHLGQRDAATLRRLESLYIGLGDTQRALEWSALSGSEEPERVLRRAEMWLVLEDPDQAQKLAQPLATNAEPAVAGRAQAILGRAALLRGDVEGAVDHWRNAGQASGTARPLARFIGARLYDRGAYEAAVEFLERGWDEGPQGRMVLELLVASHLERGAPAEARAAIVRYLERYGMDASIDVHIRRLGEEL